MISAFDTISTDHAHDPVTHMSNTCALSPHYVVVAAAIVKALAAGDVVKNAEISKENLVVRFGKAVDGFTLPKGHDHTNLDIKWDK